MNFAQFDEMESFEHTRLKPLSIALAVQAETGTILHARVATMPCKGPMATIALRKYGWRKDTRPLARQLTLQALKKSATQSLTLLTDCHPAYPRLIKKLLPHAIHIPAKRPASIPRTRTADRRNPNDPLFTFNYTAAKLRHDLSPLARKVWVTTRKRTAAKLTSTCTSLGIMATASLSDGFPRGQHHRQRRVHRTVSLSSLVFTRSYHVRGGAVGAAKGARYNPNR